MSHMEEKSMILNHQSVKQKLNRVAYQILEDVYSEEEIYLLGLRKNGYLIAEFLKDVIGDKKKCHIVGITIDKQNPAQSEVEMDIDVNELNGKSVILVDDVANTGRILSYAIKPLLNVLPNKIRVMVLVDRKHKKYPVSADFVGLSLATTMQEHITVQIENGKVEAYLD